MSPDDRIRLKHMVDAAQAALRFTHGRQREDLDTDEQLLFAVLRAVEVVGEAASRISAAGHAEAAAIPWPLIVSMRNRLAHAYFDVDKNIVWNTVTKSLPILLAQVRALDLSD